MSKLLIVLLILGSLMAGCNGSSDEGDNPDLFVGQKRYYRFVENGADVGHYEYEVINKEDRQGTEIYTVKSFMDIASSTECYPSTAEATFLTDEMGHPISFKSDASIGYQWGRHLQSVDCQIHNGMAHVELATTTLQRAAPDPVRVEDVRDSDVLPNSVMLSDLMENGWDYNLVGGLDFIYGHLPLKEGESFNIPVFFPVSSASRMIPVNVRQEREEIKIGGIRHDVFVCDVPTLKHAIHYVAEDGTLLKIEMPWQDITIELVHDPWIVIESKLLSWAPTPEMVAVQYESWRLSRKGRGRTNIALEEMTPAIGKGHFGPVVIALRSLVPASGTPTMITRRAMTNKGVVHTTSERQPRASQTVFLILLIL